MSPTQQGRGSTGVAWAWSLAALAAFTLVTASACRSGSSSEPRPTTTSGIPAPTTARAVSTTAPTTVPSTTMSTPTVELYDPYAGTSAAVQPADRATEGRIRTADGRIRHYRLYVPASLAAGEQAPLLIALHGGLGSSAQFEAQSGFDGLAESNGFIVAYPDGIGARADGSGPQTWNGGYCCGEAARQAVDDVGFVRQLIDVLVAELPVDPARIYAAGHSNGAIMAYRLACELADRIAAVGVQAGSLGVDVCTPSRPVSVVHLHGTADTNHPIEGGLGTGVAGVAFRPARAAVETMADVDGCGATPTQGTDPSNPDLTVTTWSGCRAGTEVRYAVVDGATHAWMGHPAVSAAADAYVGEPYPALDASRAIWAFLASHPRR